MTHAAENKEAEEGVRECCREVAESLSRKEDIGAKI